MGFIALERDKAYDTINGWMEAHFDEELEAVDFYRLVFPEGELETQEERDGRAVGKYAAIAYQIDTTEKEHNKQKAERWTVTDELENIEEIVYSNSFCVMSPISYAGSAATARNARNLYAIAVDVDNIMSDKKGVPKGLRQLEWQWGPKMPNYKIPKPTAIVSSGTGIHVYWILDKPIKLFPHIVAQLRKLRTKLTLHLWAQGVSATPDKIQYEGIYQGLRMVGSRTKQGLRVRAWRTGKKLTITEINQYVDEDCRVDDEHYKSQHTLAEAKKNWPDWYHRKIELKKPSKAWTCKPALYQWWLNKARTAQVGHRYFAMMMLAIYAIKAGIDYETLKRDIVELGEFLDIQSPADGSNNITDRDIRDALRAYKQCYRTFPIAWISLLTDIEIPRNKRNGRKQEVHLERARAVQMIDYPNGEWRNKDGRPQGSSRQKLIVEQWKTAHPDGRKADCIRETGLSKPTVYKWWR